MCSHKIKTDFGHFDFLFVYFFDNWWWQWLMHLATQEIDFARILHLLQWTLRGSRANWDGKFRMYTLTWTAFLYKNVKKNKFSWLVFLVYFKIMHYHNKLQYTVVYHTVCMQLFNHSPICRGELSPRAKMWKQSCFVFLYVLSS